jgi:hypothetical protein
MRKRYNLLRSSGGRRSRRDDSEFFSVLQNSQLRSNDDADKKQIYRVSHDQSFFGGDMILHEGIILDCWLWLRLRSKVEVGQEGRNSWEAVTTGLALCVFIWTCKSHA